MSGRGCLCGERDCPYLEMGYPWCPGHQDHHRLAPCAVTPDGLTVGFCGCPEDQPEDSQDPVSEHRDDCPWR